MRKDAKAAFVVVHGDAHLPNIVGALQASGRLASGLDGWQQQCDKQADYRYDNQQLDQRKCVTRSHEWCFV